MVSTIKGEFPPSRERTRDGFTEPTRMLRRIWKCGEEEVQNQRSHGGRKVGGREIREGGREITWPELFSFLLNGGKNDFL